MRAFYRHVQVISDQPIMYSVCAASPGLPLTFKYQLLTENFYAEIYENFHTEFVFCSVIFFILSLSNASYLIIMRFVFVFLNISSVSEVSKENYY